MREPMLKAKYLVVLPVPFSLDIPYADRQRVVIVADEQVEAERLSRARSAEEREEAPAPVLDERISTSSDVVEPQISGSG